MGSSILDTILEAYIYPPFTAYLICKLFYIEYLWNFRFVVCIFINITMVLGFNVALKSCTIISIYVIAKITCLVLICLATPSICSWKIDQKVIFYIYSFFKKHKYSQYYQSQNGQPPPNVYQLNFQYNNIYNCAICIDQFCPATQGRETILHCGHRYHSKCLSKWQYQQFENYQYIQWCPICRQQYDWTQKYDYVYAIS